MKTTLKQWKEILEVSLVCWGFGMFFALGTLGVLILLKGAYFILTDK